MRAGPAWCMVGAMALWVCASCRRSDGRPAAPPVPPAEIADGTAENAGPLELFPAVTRGHLLPDLTAGAPRPVDVLPDGTRRFLVAGMRLLDHPDGSLERAREMLPGGTSKVVELPARLGGGLLFATASGEGTQIWRAKGWMAPLEPFAELWRTAGEIVAGFDRIYVRVAAGDLIALDPASGDQISLGLLPPATRIGALAFADAWRAVAVLDLQGAVATFDAGVSWHRLSLEGQNVLRVAVTDGDFLLETSGGRYLLGPGGELIGENAPQRSGSETNERPGASQPAEEGAQFGSARTKALGRRPLRAALEDGWPVPLLPDDGARGELAATDRLGAAIFAQDGALYRVRLSDGAVVGVRSRAFPESEAQCHAIRVGTGFGFVCGTPAGSTVIYELEPPFGLRERLRFDRPRVVLSSGNGGLVVRGSCAREAPYEGSPDSLVATDPHQYCFVLPSGNSRELAFSPSWLGGDAARFHEMEPRPVVLLDGRAVFVVPSPEKAGVLVIVGRGGGVTVVPLAGDDRHGQLRHGMWLDGFEEREPGILGGWVASKEGLRGIRISLEGGVMATGSARDIERTIVAGRFGLDWGRGQGAETVDGGMTWRALPLPAIELPHAHRDTAACGPVGCVRGRWMRVGWGGSSPDDDLAAAPPPKPARVHLVPPRGISLRCELTGKVAGPAGAPAATPPPQAPVAAPALPRIGPAAPGVTKRRRLAPRVAAVAQPPPRSTWPPFRGVLAPSRGAGDASVDVGTDPMVTAQAHLYAWGPKGADWGRAGRWLARFDDRFSFPGISTTALSNSIWQDEIRAADALGAGQGPTVAWNVALDPSGQAAVLVARRGLNRADVYAIASGEPILPWQDPEQGTLPDPTSVVRLGSTWFFLNAPSAPSAAAGATLFRVDAGIVRKLQRFPRIAGASGEIPPKLVRRGEGTGLGLLVLGAPGFGQVVRDWYVLPLDPETGELEEPERLFGSDLEGQIPRRCRGDENGWLVDTGLSLPPATRLPALPEVSLSSIELRLRLEAGSVCVDAMAARGDGLGAPVHAKGDLVPAATAIPTTVTDRASGRRWELRCGG